MSETIESKNERTSIFSLIINDKVSIKYQLLTSFSFISILCGGITLAVCYALIYNLSVSLYHSAKSTIHSHSINSIQSVTNEIANGINKQLTISGQTVCMYGSLYSSLLLNNTYDVNVNDTNISILAYQRYYREYNFKFPCYFPNCPTDFQIIGRNLVYPSFLKNSYGSLLSSSSYLYSNEIQRSLRNDNQWNEYYNKYSILRRVLHGLTYLDIDLRIFYKNSLTKDILFYTTIRIDNINNKSSDFLCVHRMYPGIMLNSSNYNPCQSQWFVSAPENAFTISGPFNEPFSNTSAFTTTSKQVLHLSSYKLTIVNSATFLSTALKTTITNSIFPNDGFGAIIKFDTLEVIVWGSENVGNSTYNPYIYEYEPNIERGIDLRSINSFQFTDSKNIKWIVSTEPFLQVTNNNEITYSFIILIFAKDSTVNIPLESLKNSINRTTYRLTVTIIIICCSIIVFDIFLITWFVHYFIIPLELMKNLSNDIIDLSINDNELIDFTYLLDKTTLDMNRTDEVGKLAVEYMKMIKLLNQRNIEKLQLKKYSYNKFNKVYDIFKTKEKVVDKEITFDVLSNIYLHSTAFRRISSTVSSNNNQNNNQINSFSLDSYQSLKFKYNMNEVDIKSPALTRQNSRNINRSLSYIEMKSNQLSIDVDFSYANSSDDFTDKDLDVIEPLDIIPIDTSNDIKCIDYFTSVKSSLFIFSTIILSGVIAVMILVTFSIQSEGRQWSNQIKSNILISERLTLQAILQPKSKFVYAYFVQSAAELTTASVYLQLLLSNNFTNSKLISHGYFLPSYSSDPNNNFVSPQLYSTSHSIYYKPSDAFCNAYSCSVTHNSSEVKVTSLLDIKLRSLFYSNSPLEYVEMATFDGLSRILPGYVSSNYSSPDSCVISNVSSSCNIKYMDSSCNSNYHGIKHYPSYDPRCTDWYLLGQQGSNNFVYYEKPYRTTNNDFLIHLVSPIKSTKSKQLLAVLRSQVNFNDFTESINNLKILKNGYCYLLNSSNPIQLIYYPYVASSCNTIQCAENEMTIDEYKIFNQTVLQYISTNSSQVASQYSKGGKIWELALIEISYNTFKFTLVITVPLSDIIEPATTVSDDINQTYISMLITFIVIIILFSLMFTYFIYKLIHVILYPINELRNICQRVMADDLNDYADIIPSSYDMKILLKAFSNLMIALRFGSDIYSRGDPKKAKEIFSDSLSLFEKTNNYKGLAACENNLGCVEMSLGNYQVSEFHYLEAIRIYNLLIQKIIVLYENEREITSLQRNLSDTKGNLALLYLETRNYKKCYDILINELTNDDKTGYVRGYVIKLGIFGHYYLKQLNYNEASTYFNNALDYVNRLESNYSGNNNTPENSPVKPFSSPAYINTTNNLNSDSLRNEEEIELAKQISYYNLALYYEQLNNNNPNNILSSPSSSRIPSETNSPTNSIISYNYKSTNSNANSNISTDIDVHSEINTKNLSINLTNKNTMILLNNNIEKEYINALLLPRYMDLQTVNKIFLQLKILYSIENRYVELNLLKKVCKKLKLKKSIANHITSKRIIIMYDYSSYLIDNKLKVNLISKFKYIYDNNINYYDEIMLCHYNDRVVVDYDFNLKKNQLIDFKCLVDNIVQPSGFSVFRDALAYAIDTLQVNPSPDDWIIIFTAGNDLLSTISHENLLKKIQTTKSKIIIISLVNTIDLDVFDMSSIVDSAQHGKFVPLTGDMSVINSIFGKVNTIIQGQVIFQYF